jgi:hypothetical protein
MILQLFCSDVHLLTKKTVLMKRIEVALIDAETEIWIVLTVDLNLRVPEVSAETGLGTIVAEKEMIGILLQQRIRQGKSGSRVETLC